MRRSVSRPRRAWAWRGMVRCRACPEASAEGPLFPAMWPADIGGRTRGIVETVSLRSTHPIISQFGINPFFTDVHVQKFPEGPSFFPRVRIPDGICFPGWLLPCPVPPFFGNREWRRAMAFTCIELETRRRQLGLSQTDLGVCIGLLSPKDPADPRPVGQHTVSRWEEGVNGHDTPPYWVQDSLPEILDRIGQVRDALCRWAVPFLRGLEPDVEGVVHVPMYRSDRAFAHAFPKMAGWPASIWNDAVVRAADSLDDGRDYQFDLLRRISRKPHGFKRGVGNACDEH